MTTMMNLSQTNDRFLMALYYGYGRKDGGGQGCYIDPIKFAEYYLDRYAEFTNGDASFMPNVADAFDHYCRSIGS